MSKEDSEREQQALELAVKLLDVAKEKAKELLREGTPLPVHEVDNIPKATQRGGTLETPSGEGKEPMPILPEECPVAKRPLAKSKPVEGPRSIG